MWRQEEAGDRFYSMISMSLVNKPGARGGERGWLSGCYFC